jgi:glycosyltransferase involved in cell wall biosynthesis
VVRCAPVRIVLDYRPALRQRTGVGHYIHELATAIQSQLPPGDSLVLFSSSWKDRLRADAVPGAERVDARVPVRLLNLAWHRLEWPPVERFAGAVDVAHSAHPLLMPASAAVRVVTVHDLDFLDHPERTEAEIRRDYPALAASHAARADLVVVVSEHSAHTVRSRLGVREDRLVICRPGAPAGPAREPTTHAGPILFVGTIEPRKNLPMLFAAYERVVAGRPDAPPLVLAGRSVEQSAPILQSLAARRALAGRARYLGYVSDEERRQLYLEASMLVLPSLEEGFGMTAVEAMQAGVPVIASNRGALPEVVGDAGALVDPTDEAALAAAIEYLLANPPERLARAEAGRVRARLFTWSATAARLLDAYREAVARRTGTKGHAGVPEC